MVKYITILLLLTFSSCNTSSRVYYADKYSLNFGYNTNSKSYFLQNYDAGISALIPQIDSIYVTEDTLTIKGVITRPPFSKDGKYITVENVNILYAKQNNNTINFIDSIGLSGHNGKINVKIIKPFNSFYLLFMKDSIVPCALKFSSRKGQ